MSDMNKKILPATLYNHLHKAAGSTMFGQRQLVQPVLVKDFNRTGYSFSEAWQLGICSGP